MPRDLHLRRKNNNLKISILKSIFENRIQNNLNFENFDFEVYFLIYFSFNHQAAFSSDFLFHVEPDGMMNIIKPYSEGT